ncbi:MAG TPA: nucleotide sugar dehydrogenase [Nitrospinota bacterium]|nr:nucleotide sugar dehydrogenase [Nitrospinota bacterium]
MIKELLKKIENKKINIGVIGLGYVGMPLAVEFAKAGFKVCGIDVNKTKVNKFNKGINYIPDVDTVLFKKLLAKGRLKAYTSYSCMKDVQAISICVPTPLIKTKEPDMSYILDAANQLLKYLKPGKIVVLESTTYPGTTEEIILPLLEEKGFKVGKNIFLAFSPERVDPGNREYKTKNTPKIVGGVTPNCLKIVKALYGKVIKTVVPVSSSRSAEMVKLLENTFRAVNIGLVNEIAVMCDRLGIDVWEIIEAASTKPFGFMPFYPGPGLGGHCIPVDPHYLLWKLKTLDYKARFIELADDINTHMPHYVVTKVSDTLNTMGKTIKNSTILILGMAYKKDTGDVRESPAIAIIDLLLKKGARVACNDPFLNSNWKYASVRNSKLTIPLLKKAACAVICTNHSSYDYKKIVKNSQLVIDTRNATKGINNSKIIKL